MTTAEEQDKDANLAASYERGRWTNTEVKEKMAAGKTQADEAKWLEGIEADHNRYPDARLNWTYETTRRVLALARRGLCQTPQDRINNCGLEKVCFTEASEEWQAEKERLEARVKVLEGGLANG